MARRPGPVGTALTVAFLLVLLIAPSLAGSAGARAESRWPGPPAVGPSGVGSGPSVPPPTPVAGTALLGVAGTHDEPTSAAVDTTTGDLYVTNFGAAALGGNTVSVIDPSNGSTIETVPVGDDPVNDIFDPADGYVYVLNYGLSNNVSVLQGTSIVASIPVGYSPRWAVYDPVHRWVVVANTKSGNVSMIQGTSVVATVPVGTDPGLPAYDVRDGFVYVPNSASDNVTILNGTAHVADVGAGAGPQAAVYEATRGWTYITNSASGNATVLNGSRFVANVPLGVAPVFGADDPGSGQVYVADEGSDSVHLVNGTTVVANLSVDGSPRYVAVDPGRELAYVNDWNSSDVAVLEGGRVAAFVAVGTNPYAVSYDPVDARIDVTNFNSANLSILGEPAGGANVTASETGLPAATVWGLQWGPTRFAIDGASIVFRSPNGSFGYHAPPVPGYAPRNGSGTATVAGVPVGLTFAFGRSYPVTFSESGLELPRAWNVSVVGNGTDPLLAEGSSSSVSVDEPNGSYRYTVGSPPGYYVLPPGGFQVLGGPRSVNLTFVAATNPVTFRAVGLPDGTNWSVTAGNLSRAAAGPTIGFDEPNGTVAYAVGPVAGFEAETPTGSVDVNGSPVNVDVPFRATFPVWFNETGLPPAADWAVRLGSDVVVATRSSVRFDRPNGSYAYGVTTDASGYAPDPALGNLSVAGGATTIAIAFARVGGNATPYEIRFEAFGLPPDQPWNVTLGPLRGSSTASEIGFFVANGSYDYLVRADGFSAAPSSGSIVVDGGPANVSVLFTALPIAKYPVTFVPSGLPSGAPWNVTIGGEVGVRSGDSAFTTSLANGSYVYRIGGPPGYTFRRSGSVAVQGRGVEVPVPFGVDRYPVTFEESGLPTGTRWTVTLGGMTNASIGPDLVLWAANGTYGYSIGAVPGYVAPGPATVTVDGGPPAPVRVPYVAEGPSPSGAVGPPGPPLALIALGSGAAIAAVAIALTVRWARRSGERSGSTGTPDEAPYEEPGPPTDPE